MGFEALLFGRTFDRTFAHDGVHVLGGMVGWVSGLRVWRAWGPLFITGGADCTRKHSKIPYRIVCHAVDCLSRRYRMLIFNTLGPMDGLRSLINRIV